LGNVFYTLLTKEWPFEMEVESSEEAQKLVQQGQRPKLPLEFFNQSLTTTTTTNNDPYTRALLRVIRACWIQNPTQRASSRQVQVYLAHVLKRLGGGGGGKDGGGGGVAMDMAELDANAVEEIIQGDSFLPPDSDQGLPTIETTTKHNRLPNTNNTSAAPTIPTATPTATPTTTSTVVTTANATDGEEEEEE
jgi:hypothetical protein